MAERNKQAISQNLADLRLALQSPLHKPLRAVLEDRLAQNVSALIVATPTGTQSLQGRCQELQYLINLISTGE